jgi:serine/threonine protein kinase
MTPGAKFTFWDSMRKTMLTEKETAYIIVQLLSLVAYLNELGVMLRGIRLDNLMTVERNLMGHTFHFVSLIDFNESLKFQPGEWLSMDDFEMKPEKALFVPPEAHNRGESTEKFDCWSIGMIAHILLTGSPPFDESFDPAKEMIDNHFEWTSKARSQRLGHKAPSTLSRGSYFGKRSHAPPAVSSLVGRSVRVDVGSGYRDIDDP